MSTYTQILYQIVFGSKDYTNFLKNENQGKLFGYIVGMLNNRNCHSYQVGGYENHIHIVTHISPTVNLADLVRGIKKATHEFMVKEKSSFPRFPGWQVGYGAFTYHISTKSVLINYVLNQEQHHKKVTYKEELVQLLDENLVSYKEEYLMI
ncbi:MAG TPA: transposase [Bacteroidales bacterium]|nr:transposase [Bacteroidales bacterium]